MIILYIVFCLFSSAFFAGMETGLLSADQFAIYSKKGKKKISAIAADYLLLKPERLLNTTLIGTNISVVTAAVLTSSYIRRLLGDWVNFISTLLLSIIFLIFAEVIPKTFFRRNADTVSVGLAPILFLFFILFFPLHVVLNIVVRFLMILMGQRQTPDRVFSDKEDLRLLLKLSGKELGIPYSEQRVIDEIFEIKETMAREVMIPLHELLLISIDSSIEKVYQLYKKERKRFICVYRKRTDTIIGYIDVESIIYEDKAEINSLMKKAVFYPDTKKIPALFQEMIDNDYKVVFLSDEYGGISGMITRDQIAAEVIGYVPGTGSLQAEEISIIDRNHFIVSGTADIEQFKHQTGIDIEEGVYDTVGGYICDRLGRIPQKGETCDFGGTFYRVLDRDERHIKSLEVLKRKKHENKEKFKT